MGKWGWAIEGGDSRPAPARARGISGKPPKKGSGSGTKSVVIIAFALLAAPTTAILSVLGYLLHGHGVI